MRRSILRLGAMGLLAATVAHGVEEDRVDFWAATEVIMGRIGADTMQQLKQSPELMQQYQNVLLDQYVAQEAVKRGLTERLDVQRALHIARRSVLVRALRDELVRQIPIPTDAEVKTAYQKSREKMIVPAAYQLDVFLMPADDTAAHDAAMKLATGRPVPDADMTRLVNVQTQVLMQSGVWLTSNNMQNAIWRGLALMKEKEVRLFPDGPQTLVVRRGAAREARLLTLDEASPAIRNNLLAERADRVWSNYLQEARGRIR